MPGTAGAYGLRNPFDAARAIDTQGHLMRDLLRQFGSMPLAPAAYNAGPAPVARCGCGPAIPETQGYVRADPRTAGRRGPGFTRLGAHRAPVEVRQQGLRQASHSPSGVPLCARRAYRGTGSRSQSGVLGVLDVHSGAGGLAMSSRTLTGADWQAHRVVGPLGLLLGPIPGGRLRRSTRPVLDRACAILNARPPWLVTTSSTGRSRVFAGAYSIGITLNRCAHLMSGGEPGVGTLLRPLHSPMATHERADRPLRPARSPS